MVVIDKAASALHSDFTVLGLLGDPDGGSRAAWNCVVGKQSRARHNQRAALRLRELVVHCQRGSCLWLVKCEVKHTTDPARQHTAKAITCLNQHLQEVSIVSGS